MEFALLENALIQGIFTNAPPHSQVLVIKEITHSPK